MTSSRLSELPSRPQLLRMLAIATALAALILFAVVLPAEFHRDPLGTGQLTGLMGMSAPPSAPARSAAVVARFYPGPLRSDTVAITLAAGGQRGLDEQEWKVRMQAGQTLVYSWTVTTPPEEFFADFHGQSYAKPKPVVQSYQAGIASASHGTLTAPFDGIHGWFFQNQSAAPVVVHLQLSGFYTMRAQPSAPE